MMRPGAIRTTRRQALVAAIGLGASVVWRPALATAAELKAAINAFSGGAPVRAGRVGIDIEPLVENGNTVPVIITVDSPMTAANHVQAIALFNELNPQRDVLLARLSPRSGRAWVATRIRLATSQQLVAVARFNDGSHWSHTVEVLVTLAACIE